MTTAERRVTRKWLPLTARDVDIIERVKRGEETERDVFEHMGITLPEDAGDADAVRAIWAAGCMAFEEKTLELGYIKAAEFDRTDPERQTWLRHMRNRSPFLNDESTT